MASNLTGEQGLYIVVNGVMLGSLRSLEGEDIFAAGCWTI